jgi:hypothetical protein
MIVRTMAGKKAGRKLRRLLRFLVSGIVALLFCIGAWLLWRYHGPAAPVEIFQGITYGCERLPDTTQSGGLLHWVRADLNVPGVSLYVTPCDPDAMSKGFEYKLNHTSTSVADNGLAAAVNGTLFASDSSFIRLPGDLANSSETIVADHVVNHIDPNSYLMWWSDDSIAHLERWKPPPPESVAAAKWAISGQAPMLRANEHAQNSDVDQRTIIAADPEKKLVWICCFDKASYQFISYLLQSRRAKIAIAVDGGSSMAMAIGSGAKNVRSGTVTGNWRPVATVFGFRAKPLR